jgi:nucleoside-diphosphate-sugar epimerase
MAKILVIGGAGYIGSVLTPELLAKGHDVCVVDSFMYGQNSLALTFMDPHVEIINTDCRNLDSYWKQANEADFVIPLAAIVGAPACAKDPIGSYETNVKHPLNLIATLGREVKIIMPTTNSAYGTTPSGEVSTETSSLNPISAYARHKVEVEEALIARGNSTSLRLATVFGMSPRMRLDLLVNDMVYRAITDKSVVLFEADFIRNFIHVRDVSAAIIHAMENWSAFEGEIFNVGLSSANVSKRQLCEVIKTMIPEFTFVESPFGKDPDQRSYVVSNEKIEKTGFRTSVSLEEGVRELIKGIPTLSNKVYGNI